MPKLQHNVRPSGSASPNRHVDAEQPTPASERVHPGSARAIDVDRLAPAALARPRGSARKLPS